MSTISGISTSSTVFDLFEKVDSAAGGEVSRSELQTLSEMIAESTLDASEESFAQYDSDGNGTLSEDELNAVLDSGKPPLGMEGMAPPPPPSRSPAQNGLRARPTADSAAHRCWWPLPQGCFGQAGPMALPSKAYATGGALGCNPMGNISLRLQRRWHHGQGHGPSPL